MVVSGYETSGMGHPDREGLATFKIFSFSVDLHRPVKTLLSFILFWSVTFVTQDVLPGRQLLFSADGL